jgi:hypothetical protein
MDRASGASRARGKAVAGVLLVLAFGWARAEAQSARPIEGSWVPNGTVSAIAAGGGGVYVGGSFDAIGPSTCTISGSNLYVGGSFTTIAGNSCSRLAAFNRTTGAILGDGRGVLT